MAKGNFKPDSLGGREDVSLICCRLMDRHAQLVHRCFQQWSLMGLACCSHEKEVSCTVAISVGMVSECSESVGQERYRCLIGMFTRVYRSQYCNVITAGFPADSAAAFGGPRCIIQHERREVDSFATRIT